MNMKKSLIAVAVAGAVVAPLSAAQAAEAYGTLNVNAESNSFDKGGATNAAGTPGTVIFAAGDDKSGVVMNDIQQSRFGFKGDEDLGNGLTAMYRLELGFSTNNEGGGLDKRLGWVGLSGDFGQVKVGDMWGVIYQYSGWNSWRTCCEGGAPYYYTTSLLNDDAYGLRVDNAIEYTYGGGGYSSDPFTFSVQLRAADEQSNATNDGTPGVANDEESIDTVIVGAQGTVGDFTINGFSYSEAQTTGPEVSAYGLGGRWSSGPILVGVSYQQVDLDNAAGNKPSSLQVTADYDLGGGLNVVGSVGTGDADTNGGVGDLTSYFVRLDKDLSSRTELYGEYESATTDKTGPSGGDGETSVLTAGIRHSF